MKLDLSAYGVAEQEDYYKIKNLEEYPWIVGDDSIEQVMMIYSIQIIKNLPMFMEELYRVCKNGAVIRVMAPYYTNEKSIGDPSLVRQINEYTFAHFDKEFRKINFADNGPFKNINFKVKGFDYQWVEEQFNVWKNKSEEAKAYARRHYWNVIDTIVADIEVIK